MNQRDFENGRHNILSWIFYLHVSLGVVDIWLHSPVQYGLPFNSGWILILGFLTVISALENKK